MKESDFSLFFKKVFLCRVLYWDLMVQSVAHVGVSRAATCGHHYAFELQGHSREIICLCSTFILQFIAITALV